MQFNLQQELFIDGNWLLLPCSLLNKKPIFTTYFPIRPSPLSKSSILRNSSSSKLPIIHTDLIISIDGKKFEIHLVKKENVGIICFIRFVKKKLRRTIHKIGMNSKLCSGKEIDINFGNRLYSKENCPGSPLLF